MPRATDQSNIYMWAEEALKLLGPAYGSPETAELVLLRAAKAKQIPWTHMDVEPPEQCVDQMWQQVGYSLHPQLAQNKATFLAVYPAGTGGMGTFIVKVGGIKFERAAIMALLPANTAEAPAVDAVPSSDSAVPKPHVKTAAWQRTEIILLKLYSAGMPSEHKVKTADIIKAIKIEWKVVPNPQHVMLPSDGTLRTVIKEQRKARPAM